MNAWRSVPLRAIYQRVELRGRADLPLLSVYRDHGVVPRDERDDNNNRPSDDLSTYKYVRPGDLVVNKMKTWQGSLAVSGHEGIVSPAYFVGRRVADVDDRFMHHLLRSMPLIAEYGARSKGIRPSQWDLPWDEFAAIKVWLPSAGEQRAIADYLDTETARIDALIAKKQRMIELIDEAFVAEIGKACEELPQSAPIKRIAEVSYGLGQPPALSEPASGTVPIIRATNINRGRIEPADLIHARIEDLPLGRAPLLREGEILVVRSGALTGDSALITGEWVGAAPGYDLRVSPKSIDSRLLAWQLLGVEVWAQLQLVRMRAAQPHLNAEDLGAVMVRTASPAAQAQVADRLDSAAVRSRRLVERLAHQIDLLREHRQALITAAVTGELEIPGVAA